MTKYFKAFFVLFLVSCLFSLNDKTISAVSAQIPNRNYSLTPPCTPPMKDDGTERCVSGLANDDIVVTGYRYRGASLNFNLDLYNQWIKPYYNNSANSLFGFMPVNGFIARIRELQRRRLIHDCIANELAQGFRETGIWAQREISFRYGEKTARFDMAVGLIPGVPTGIWEVKTVLDYERAADDLLVRNQPTLAQAIRDGTAIPFGDNAKAAGFVVDKPLGKPLQFTVFEVQVRPSCGLGS